MLVAYLTLNLFCLCKVCRCRMRKKGLGATEWLWAGWTPDEGWACYRALWLINSQLVPGQRWTREDWHRPGHHRTSTANGSTSRRFVAPASFLYGQHRAKKKNPLFKGSPNKPQSLCHWGTFGHFVPGENDCRYSEEDVICLTNFECLSDRHGKKSALACTPILINTLSIDSNSEQSVDSRAVRNYNSMQPFSFMAGCVRVSLLVGLLVHFDLVPEPDCHCMVNKNGTVISCR